jgi:elongation factor G
VGNTSDIRNIVLLGHGSSGKTSLAEAIIHKTGATSRLGSVDDKTSICDFSEEEKQHQHSISSSVVHASYAGKTINIIDTPGYPDFIGPAIKAIPAAETAIIVINATAGIETNTRKLFQLALQAKKAPIIVINKIDSDNIHLPELLKNIQETFGSTCRCANLPAQGNNAVIDCIENNSGDSPLADVAQAHTDLIESVIEADDELMESYLSGEQISAAKIASVFSEALITGTLVPVVFTNARQEIGVSELIDIIAKFTPSPSQASPAVIKDADQSTKSKPRPQYRLQGSFFALDSTPAQI